ncbi:antitoxin Xre-like helix-turn-helix domain-containing protein [Inquilinus sp.]|jgi:hypothetical protein|uniref:MbcA/ParS/Xre antitoxin family protein n=1 Tax=Inquilinus sp. TaxID=1932117 RepID=UPI0037831757
MAVPNARASAAASREEVLSKATARVAEHWGLTNGELAAIVGLSPASISRLKSGSFTLEAGTKAFECAQLLARLFRGLDALTGSDDNASRYWLRHENTVLQGRPVEKMRTIIGLIDTVNYVDTRRAVI